LNLIDHLPRHSFFIEAVSQDEELAEALAQSAPEEDPEERLSIWTPERELLAAVYDRLGSVIAALVAVNGGHPPDIIPFPRPVSAAQRARIKSRREDHARLVARLLDRP
jgi:hypothetical protein